MYGCAAAAAAAKPSNDKNQNTFLLFFPRNDAVGTPGMADHVDHIRFPRARNISPCNISHSGHDRANARISRAFCYGQQSRNVGVAREAGRGTAKEGGSGKQEEGKGRRRRNSSKFQRSGPDNSTDQASKIKDAPDIRRRCERARARAIRWRCNFIHPPGGNPSGETKASNGGNPAGNSPACE